MFDPHNCCKVYRGTVGTNKWDNEALAETIQAVRCDMEDAEGLCLYYFV